MPPTIFGRGVWGRLRTAAAALVLAFLLLLDLFLVVPQEPRVAWPLLVAGVLTAALSLSPGSLAFRAALGAACSGVVTAWLFTLQSSRTWGLAESAALLLLIAAVSRLTAARIAVPCLVALCGAVIAQPFRLAAPVAQLYSLLLAFPATAAIALGGVLRLSDQRKSAELQAVREAVRQKERLDLARELHDFVAHHVTGIVVQAQAAQVVAAQDAAAVTSALKVIEQAGAEALASMRRLVAVLRGEEVSLDPGSDVGQLRELVEGFTRSSPGLAVALDIGDGLEAAHLPPPLVSTVYRVVQESLTNVRRHAAGATTVRITLDRIHDRLHVCVRDDGQATTSSLDPGTGFGLAGLTERLDSLGGTLRVGPQPEGGWEVLATLPVPRRAM
ncbi:MAG: sensor histidine kinase [Egibacteraceae bacterium]